MEKFIPKADCVGRRLYRIHSRNLLLGVYQPDTGGFLGIREKFGRKYVFPEFHRDNGPPFGTVTPVEDLGVDLPEDILLSDHLPGSWDKTGTREVEWRPDEPGGKVGKWFFKDTGEHTPGGGYVRENKALFDWLTAREKEFLKLRVRLDETTAKAVAGASIAAGDTSILAKVTPGNNELTEEELRGLWFTLQVLCDQNGPPADAAPGSPESFFGCLKDHAPALTLLKKGLAAYAPQHDLMSDLTGLRDH